MDSDALFYLVTVMWFVFGVFGLLYDGTARSLHCVYRNNPIRLTMYLVIGAFGGPWYFVPLGICFFIDEHFIQPFFPVKKEH